jgi:hypothetical protein
MKKLLTPKSGEWLYMLYWKEQDTTQFKYLSKYRRILCIAPMELNRCQIIIYSGFRHYLFWLKFVQVIFCYSPQRMWICQLFSFHHKKTYTILITTGQVTGLSLESTAVNHLGNTLPSCAHLGSFNVSCLKISFTLSLDAINDSKKRSFHFFIPQTVASTVLYKATTSLQFPPFSSILIISSFWENVMFPFANHTFILYLDLLKPLQ